MPDFSLSILQWYRQNKRDLPWRRTKDPYKIWLSEIILQQTRVDQGMSYYEKFIQHYPKIEDLANAEEIDVLNDWQGLGYYSRARNLHFTAKYITDSLGGQFPNTYQEILKLKGVGPYTAAAISSISFNEAKAVVDGNVYRVLARYFGIEDPIDKPTGINKFQKVADKVLIADLAGEFNQAIMEFGARQCKPALPLCDSCPISTSCYALENKEITRLPIKAGKTRIRNRYLLFHVIKRKGKIALTKRTKNDVWKHLYQLPVLEFESAEMLSTHFQDLNCEPIMLKHQLSHQKIHAYFIEKEELAENDECIWASIDELDRYPFPVLITRYFEANLFDD